MMEKSESVAKGKKEREYKAREAVKLREVLVGVGVKVTGVRRSEKGSDKGSEKGSDKGRECKKVRE
jgi:hypothetical protein